ncbi:hypothetical protein VNI00_004141 [Paramarasmius palmivorus]|uniref:Uncharacterized protein n=1 Tax=Paramarasmius palmivorus TaxID=297713 RepID=A0AAW0DNB1_9AGAR
MAPIIQNQQEMEYIRHGVVQISSYMNDTTDDDEMDEVYEVLCCGRLSSDEEDAVNGRNPVVATHQSQRSEGITKNTDRTEAGQRSIVNLECPFHPSQNWLLEAARHHQITRLKFIVVATGILLDPKPSITLENQKVSITVRVTPQKRWLEFSYRRMVHHVPSAMRLQPVSPTRLTQKPMYVTRGKYADLFVARIRGENKPDVHGVPRLNLRVVALKDIETCALKKGVTFDVLADDCCIVDVETAVWKSMDLAIRTSQY